MGVKVIWTDFALSQLEDIYDYFKTEAGQSIAKRIVKDLIKETLVLERNPFLGVQEPHLIDRPFEYRYLVKKNYKIIYRYNDSVIRVVSVFDSRQNPAKIDKTPD